MSRYVLVCFLFVAVADLAPGLGQEGEVRLHPTFERSLSLERRLNALPAPILVSPDPGSIRRTRLSRNDRLTFRWRSGDPLRKPDYYRICVNVEGSDCTDPDLSLVATVPGDRTEYSPDGGLDGRKFMAHTLEWKVSACWRPPPPATADKCVASPTRQFFWVLSRPTLSGGFRDGTEMPGVPRYVFHASVVPGASGYSFCLFNQRLNDCRFEIDDQLQPYVKVKSLPFLEVAVDIREFRGKDIQWTVAACKDLDKLPNHPGALPLELRCTPQPDFDEIHFVNELVAPHFSSFPFDDSGEGLTLTWELARKHDIHHLEFCAVWRHPTNVFRDFCDVMNFATQPIRAPTDESCTIDYPYPQSLLDGPYAGFDIRVSACNETGQCYSEGFVTLEYHGDVETEGTEFRCTPGS